MKKKSFNALPWTMYVLMVVCVCMLLSGGSCAFTSEGLSVISGDYTSPTLNHFTLESATDGFIQFSHEVEFPVLEYYLLESADEQTIASFSNDVRSSAQFIGPISAKRQPERTDEETASYTLEFPYETQAHLQYILSGTVKDTIGSTLSFTISFTGYNARVPKMIFSEISTEYSKPRTEFVEFYVLEDGNLAGIILHSASDGVDKDYTFPSVEVKKGEYIVLHMRTVEEGAVNELEDDITLSTTKQSSQKGRDLWIEGTETRLSKNDVLLLRERVNGSLLDAIAYLDGAKDDWPKDALVSYIQEAADSSLWEGGKDVANAANIEYITGTRTFCRQNILEIQQSFDLGNRTITNSKNDWIVVATSNASPGSANSSKAHVN